MAHSKEAHAKKSAMPQFNEGHWEKKQGMLSTSDGRYTSGEMDNPEHLSKSVAGLASYAKKHRAKH